MKRIEVDKTMETCGKKNRLESSQWEKVTTGRVGKSERQTKTLLIGRRDLGSAVKVR